jgi:hypothetical protein
MIQFCTFATCPSMTLLYAVCRLEIRRSSIIRPIAIPTPPQRIILGTANFSSLGINITLEFRWCAAEVTDVHILIFLFGSCCMSDLRCSGCSSRSSSSVCRGDGDVGLFSWLKRRRYRRSALKTLEFGLLVGGQFWW